MNRLRLLRELGDRGSVTAVAAALHISPSAVSQQLAALQSTAPVPLTERQGRRLVLTDAGRALAAAAARVEEAVALADDTISAYLARDERPVRVSAFHSAGLALFAPLLRELGPHAGLSLADADVEQEAFPGLTADYDLVVAHRLAHQPAWETDRVVVTPLLREPLDIAMSSTHRLAQKAAISPSDLVDERWVSTHEGFPLAGVLAHLGARMGKAPRIDHRVNEFSVTAQIVRAGAGIAVMPRLTAAPLVDESMVLRPVAGVSLVRHVDVLARPAALARTRVREVLAALRRVATAASAPALPPPHSGDEHAEQTERSTDEHQRRGHLAEDRP